MENSTEITLLDFFAGQALAGMNANPGNDSNTEYQLAEIAYDFAEAMLAERKRRLKQ